MPSLSAEQRRAQARYAAAVRRDLPDKAERARDLAAIRIQNYVKKVVDSAPPLTESQRADIAALLAGGRSA